MEKKSIGITKAELSAIISDYDREQTRLYSKRRNANKRDKPAIEAELKILFTRLRELETVFDAWPWPNDDTV